MTDSPHRVLDLIGLTLDDARTVWRESGVRDEDIEIIETAPPIYPAPREKSPQRKTKTPRKPPKAAPNFGQWRVLRVIYSEDFGDNGGKIEVTVAREELKSDEANLAATLESSIE